jgi:hypothetical protein
MKKLTKVGVALIAAFALTCIGSASASAATVCEIEPNGEPKYANPVTCFNMTSPIATGLWKLVTIAAWLVDGAQITEALATETEGELELTDLSNSSGVLCKEISDGTVGPEGINELLEVLNAEKEKIEAALPLLCKAATGSACEENTTDIEVVPVNLPWLTQLVLTEGEPEFLDYLSGSSEGKEPGWKVSCLVLGIKITDTCEGVTSAKVENTVENDVLATFNPAAPISSRKANCSIGGAETGDTAGVGLILLTSGKTLAVSE